MAGNINVETNEKKETKDEKKPEYKSLYGFSKDNSSVLLYCLAENNVVPAIPNSSGLQDKDILDFIVAMKKK